jgi:hypothetical protein
MSASLERWSRAPSLRQSAVASRPCPRGRPDAVAPLRCAAHAFGHVPGPCGPGRPRPRCRSHGRWPLPLRCACARTTSPVRGEARRGKSNTLGGTVRAVRAFATVAFPLRSPLALLHACGLATNTCFPNAGLSCVAASRRYGFQVVSCQQAALGGGMPPSFLNLRPPTQPAPHAALVSHAPASPALVPNSQPGATSSQPAASAAAAAVAQAAGAFLCSPEGLEGEPT